MSSLRSRGDTRSSGLGLRKSCRGLGTPRGLTASRSAALTLNGSFPKPYLPLPSDRTLGIPTTAGRHWHHFDSTNGEEGCPAWVATQPGCLFFSVCRLKGWRPLVPIRSSEARTERSGFPVGIVKTCRSLAAFTDFMETWPLSTVDLMSLLHSNFVGNGNFPGKLGKSFNLCRLTGSLLN